MSKQYLKTIIFTKKEMEYEEYQEILKKEMEKKKVNNINDLANEHILIGELSKKSTLLGAAGIQNKGKERITETFKEFKKAGVQTIICTSDSLDYTKYFAQ
jgi:magnesium-transporting ATPase (P-type)